MICGKIKLNGNYTVGNSGGKDTGFWILVTG